MDTGGSRDTTLDADECRRLLDTMHVGRVALSDRALPIIVPVAYLTDGDDVVFDAEGRALSRAAHDGHVVCFEAGAVDGENIGWTVTVIGRLVVDDQRSALEGGSPGRTATTRTKVRLVPEIISGRSRQLPW